MNHAVAIRAEDSKVHYASLASGFELSDRNKMVALCESVTQFAIRLLEVKSASFVTERPFCLQHIALLLPDYGSEKAP